MRRRSFGGAALLFGVSSVVGASIWFAQADFGPVGLPDAEQAVRYVFRPAPAAWLAADIVGSVIAVVLLHAVVFRAALGRRPDLPPSYDEVRCLWPLGFVGLNFAALGVFVPALSAWWGPIAYVAVDLHAIVVAGAITLCALGLRSQSTKPIAAAAGWANWRLDDASRLLLSDLAIGAIAAAVVILSTPLIRFSPIVGGDEPKYLRYCESWWQGQGVDIEHVQDIRDLPASASSNFRHVAALLVSALAADAKSLGADVRTLGRQGFSHRFNRGQYVGGWYVAGKRGGVYQMHNPGLSVLIFPAYAVDRAFFDGRSGRFPDDLFSVNLLFLTIFASVVATMSRLARAAGASDAMSWAVALGVGLSMPIAAFAFQFYPEMPAALIIALLCTHLLGRSRLGWTRAGFFGLALGWLGWMHIRFLPIAAIGVVWLTWAHRAERSVTACVLFVFGLLSAGLCLYAYHITGSLVPTAVYLPTGGHSQFSWDVARLGVFEQIFDRDYGLVPLAPILLLAFPGLGLMFRRSPRALFLVLSFGVPLLIMSGGHGAAAGGTSPGRFMLAVVPLASVPLTEWMHVARRRPLLIALTALLLAVSIRSCIGHDLHNAKIFPTLTEENFSGWNPAMLFPQVRYAARLPVSFNSIALFVWTIIAAGGVAWGAAARPEEERSQRQPVDLRGPVMALCLAGLAAAGVLAIAAGGPKHEPRFLPDPENLAAMAAKAEDAAR